MPLFATCAIFFTFFSVILMNVHKSESNVNLCTSQTSFEQTGHPLPLRNHTWQIIRESNFLYIDKTPFLMKLLKGNKFIILTRPPGFGKTTFLDMMADFFREKKDMFKGLAIDAVGNTKHYPWNKHESSEPLPKWKEFPVIHLNFGEISNFNTEEEFDSQYEFLLKRIAKTYNVNADEKYFDLSSLIIGLYIINYNPVAILVDEYDYPFHHAYTVLNNTKLATQMKYHLESMMSVIKASTERVGLAFFAGVLKLNTMSMGSSGMNVFDDLTLDKNLAEAFGFTENEIKNNMSPYLKKWAQNRDATENVKNISDNPTLHEKIILDGLRNWHGGYQFSEECDANEVFNPISAMESLQKQKFGSYCTPTDSMRFLVHQFYENNECWDNFMRFYSMMDTDVRYIYRVQQSPNCHKTPRDLWMFSHGYYTISNCKRNGNLNTGEWLSVTFKFPNKEMEEAIEYNLAMYLPEEKKFIHKDYSNELVEFSRAMSTQDTEKAMKILSIFQFRSYINPSNKNMNPGEMAKRLGFFLLAASINYQEGVKFNTDTNFTSSVENGDILQTTDLKMNYIIKIQTTNNANKTAFPAIKQLLGYFRNYPRSFAQGEGNQTNFCFLGLNFVFIEGSAKLKSWIALPFVSGVPQYSNVVAQPQKLKQKLLEEYQ